MRSNSLLLRAYQPCLPAALNRSSPLFTQLFDSRPRYTWLVKAAIWRVVAEPTSVRVTL